MVGGSEAVKCAVIHLKRPSLVFAAASPPSILTRSTGKGCRELTGRVHTADELPWGESTFKETE